MSEYFSIESAAQYLGPIVTEYRLRRLVDRGIIPSVTQTTAKTTRTMISREALDAWAAQQETESER